MQMVSSVSQVDICNMALDMLREGPINSLTDDDDRADWFRRNYPQTRDSLLARHPWNFAIKYASLAENTAGPTSQWTYAYDLPADLLRLLPIQKDGHFEGQMIPHEVIGQTIETDEAPPLRVRYIRRVESEGLFSTVFVDALAAKLAMRSAHWITGKVSSFQIAQEAYIRAMDEATRVDGQEGTFERAYDDDVISVRG
jgi:hypothetical protein